MAKNYRLFLGTYIVSFQIGVNVLGFPEFHTHTLLRTKVVKEVDLHKYQ